MSEQNKSLVRRFYDEVENQGKLEVVDELFAADFRDVYNTASPFPVKGIEGVKKLAVGLHEHLDLTIEIEDLVAEGDTVVARIACGITHKNPFMGAAPTGRKFVARGVEIFRVVGGKLAERWVYIDMMPMMKELGVVPK
ncbi:MAG: ester cyclase [Betaproteobacteria bacterium]|nr:ester cyclase [Betaproteobacteria bacterium]